MAIALWLSTGAAFTQDTEFFDGESWMNEKELYIYGEYFDHLSRMREGREAFIDSLRREGYGDADALAEHVALMPLLDASTTDGTVRERIDRLLAAHPVAAPLIGARLMRMISRGEPEFEEYVASVAGRAAEFWPDQAVEIARYIANNYLIVYADVVAADPWVDRYLAWSGDPDYEREMTRVVKQATGEYPCDDFGRLMPDYELRALDGTTVSVGDLRGEFVLLDFWASWCGPCKAELPHVKQARQTFADAPIRFVSVTCDRDDSAWRRAVEEIDVPWLHLSADGTDMLKEYGVAGIPRIMVLDPEGRLVADNLTGRTIEMQLSHLAAKYGWK